MNKYLIENWKKAYRMASMWVAMLSAAYSQLPEAHQLAVLRLLHVSEADLLGYAAILFVVTRLIKQPALAAPPPPQ